ncbi:hypothetical protein BY458DRAFT_468978 [Sporodiniella umbellata]|nr:hypothetical protein BY458DRAFT_468978 [Sporodiniella umbellata]
MAATVVQAPLKEATLVQSAQDVGLIFVREYYTFLNKRPDRLFAFYKKDSLFTRGDEGVPTEMASGQEEIGKKLKECNFEDCKVLVTQVDSQLSANNGIIVHVLGEMCNQTNASQKFSQTFFLATQPNGYYVLNDIFRFLKDEVNIDYYHCEEEESDEAVPQVCNIPVKVLNLTEDAIEGPKETILEKSKGEKNSSVVSDVAEPVITSPIPSKITKPTDNDNKSLLESKSTPLEPRNTDQEVKQEVEQQQPSKQGSTKTWANLTAAATIPSVPGTSTGTTSPELSAPVTPEAPSPVISEAEKPASSDIQEISLTVPVKPFKTAKGEETVKPNGPKAQPKHVVKPDQTQTHTIPPNSVYYKNQGPRNKDFVTQIFVKQIHDTATEEQIKEAFTIFGPVKYANLTKNRSCAFLEFISHESVPKALAQHKVLLANGHTVLAEERRYNNYPVGNRFSHNNNQNRNQNYNNNSTFERKPNNNYRRPTTRPNPTFVKAKTVPTPSQKV